MGVFDLFGFCGLGVTVLFNDGMKAQDRITLKNENKIKAIKNGNKIYSSDDKYHCTHYYAVKNDIEVSPSQICHQNIYYYKGTDIVYYNEGEEISNNNKEKAKQYGLKYYEYKNYYYLIKFFNETTYDINTYTYLRDIDDNKFIKIDAFLGIICSCDGTAFKWSNRHKMTKNELCCYSLYWSSDLNKIMERVLFNWDLDNVKKNINGQNNNHIKNYYKTFFDDFFNDDYAITFNEAGAKYSDLFLKANLIRKTINKVISSLNKILYSKKSINIADMLNECIYQLNFVIKDIDEIKKYYTYYERNLTIITKKHLLLKDCLVKTRNILGLYNAEKIYEVNTECSELISMLYDFKY